MRVTWKDGVTTLATLGAGGIGWAHFQDWNWPLISDARWAIVGIAVLALVGYMFSYLLDEAHDRGWSVTANILAVMTVGLMLIGGIFGAPEYIVLLMLSTIVFWAVSIVTHLTAPTSMTHSHV